MGILPLPDRYEDLGRLHITRQAIGAQEQLVPLHQRDFIEIDVNGVVDTQGTGDDVLLRRPLSLLFRQHPPPDLFGNQRVIGRQRLDRVPADQVHATVANMGD